MKTQFIFLFILFSLCACNKKQVAKEVVNLKPLAAFSNNEVSYEPEKAYCNDCSLDKLDEAAKSLSSSRSRANFKDLHLGMNLQEVAIWAKSNKGTFKRKHGEGYNSSYESLSKLTCKESTLGECHISLDTTSSDFPVKRIDLSFYKNYLSFFEVIYNVNLGEQGRLNFIKGAIEKWGNPTGYYYMFNKRGTESKDEWIDDNIKDGKYCTSNTAEEGLRDISNLRWKIEDTNVDLLDITS